MKSKVNVYCRCCGELVLVVINLPWRVTGEEQCEDCTIK